MSALTPDRIRAAARWWREVEQAATPGPWTADAYVLDDYELFAGHQLVASRAAAADARLIAAARAPLATVAAMLETVAEEHQPLRPGYAASICARCGQDGGLLVTYPCPTVLAVTPWVQAAERGAQ